MARTTLFPVDAAELSGQGLVLDIKKRRLLKNGELLPLSDKKYALIDNQGAPVDVYILAGTWGDPVSRLRLTGTSYNFIHHVVPPFGLKEKLLVSLPGFVLFSLGFYLHHIVHPVVTMLAAFAGMKLVAWLQRSGKSRAFRTTVSFLAVVGMLALYFAGAFFYAFQSGVINSAMIEREVRKAHLETLAQFHNEKIFPKTLQLRDLVAEEATVENGDTIVLSLLLPILNEDGLKNIKGATKSEAMQALKETWCKFSIFRNIRANAVLRIKNYEGRVLKQYGILSSDCPAPQK